MEEVVGRTALTLGAVASLVAFLVAFRLNEKNPTLENGLLCCFVLSHTYSTVCLMVGAFVPLQVVYQRPDLLEMIHRSRYLVFDCVALPCILWLMVSLAFRSFLELMPGLANSLGVVGKPSAGLGLMQVPAPWGPAVLVLLGVGHAVAACLAAGDCSKYPFTTENCLGVLYWRPARFTHRMKYPWTCTVHALWMLGAVRVLIQGTKGTVGLLAATGLLRLAFHGHMSQWKHWPWEIFLQPFATAAVSAALLSAMDVGLRCDWHSMDPTACLVVVPGGAVPLFGVSSRLRF